MLISHSGRGGGGWYIFFTYSSAIFSQRAVLTSIEKRLDPRGLVASRCLGHTGISKETSESADVSLARWSWDQSEFRGIGGFNKNIMPVNNLIPNPAPKVNEPRPHGRITEHMQPKYSENTIKPKQPAVLFLSSTHEDKV